MHRKGLQNRDSRLSHADNESQVNGLGVTVGENMAKMKITQNFEQINDSNEKSKEDGA